MFDPRYDPLHSFHTGIDDHGVPMQKVQTSPNMGTSWLGRETDHSVEDEAGGAIPPRPHTPSCRDTSLCTRVSFQFPYSV
jgi:hypothetical protein